MLLEVEMAKEYTLTLRSLKTLVGASLLFSMALGGCRARQQEPVTREEAMRIVAEWWKLHLPQVKVERLDICTSNLGSKWRLRYDTPGGSTGGPFDFEVDRISRKITYVHGGQ